MGHVVLQDRLQVAVEKVVEHVVAVSDDHVQHRNGQQQVPALCLLQDDLRQDKGGDVFLGLGVQDLNPAPLADHLRYLLQGHIGAFFGVVEPPVGVLLENHGFVHVAPVLSFPSLLSCTKISSIFY